MEQKIYPFLINERKLNEYYNFLIKNNYSIKIFDKKNDEEIYDLYLPQIRNLMFWTFFLKEKKESFKQLSNGLKASICQRYTCNIFEKKNTIVICFNNGICFTITEDKNEARKLKNNENKIDMNKINLREEQNYDIPKEIQKNKNEEYIYLYIIQLYKMIYMHKALNEIQQPAKFNKVRTEFVKFVQEIYNTKATDNKEATEMCKKWEEILDLEKLQIKIDNEFDLIYKNNKLNNNIKIQILCIFLCTITIIIGIINLWGTIQ